MQIRYRQQSPASFPWQPGRSRPAPGQRELDELFKLEDLDVHWVPGERLLLINHRTRRRGEIPARLAPVLNAFDRFRSFPEHREAARQALTGAGLSNAASDGIVEDLFRAGLMVSARDWLTQISPPGPDPGPDPAPDPAQAGPWVLMLTTCDRPDRFERLLESLVPHLATVDPPPEQVLISDDSRDADARERNRERVLAWLADPGVPVDYWDRARRAVWSRGLAQRFPASAGAIRWLLDPGAFAEAAQTFGQVRNLTTLLAAGRRYLTIDDDCILNARARPDAGKALRVQARGRDERPYPDVDALWRATADAGVNPLAAHLVVLGQSLRSAFAARGDAWEAAGWLREADPATLTHLDAQARVGATGNGMLGDPGSTDMLGFYAAAGDTVEERSAFMQRAVDAGRLQRTFCTVCPQPTFTLGGRLISPVLGLDNRQPVPCVPPTGRGSNDDVLGTVLQGLLPHLGHFDFAWALPHRADAPAPWIRPQPLAERPRPAPESQLNDAIQQAAAELSGSGPDARMQELVDHFRTRARESDVALRAYVDESIARALTLRRQMCEPNRQDARVQGPMREDLEQYIANLETELATPFVPGPEWLQIFRAQCEAYAQGLALWPALRGHVIESGAA